MRVVHFDDFVRLVIIPNLVTNAFFQRWYGNMILQYCWQWSIYCSMLNIYVNAYWILKYISLLNIYLNATVRYLSDNFCTKYCYLINDYHLRSFNFASIGAVECSPGSLDVGNLSLADPVLCKNKIFVSLFFVLIKGEIL